LLKAISCIFIVHDRQWIELNFHINIIAMLSKVSKTINLISKRNQVHKMLLKQSSRNFATNEVKTTDKGGELQQKEQFL